MTARDILAALSVAIVWGLSFIAIKVGVGETSPLMLAALRFLFAAVPMVASSLRQRRRHGRLGSTGS